MVRNQYIKNYFVILACLSLSLSSCKYCIDLNVPWNQQSSEQKSTSRLTDDRPATSKDQEDAKVRLITLSPPKFKDRREALKNHCQIHYLKSKRQESCVLHTYAITHDYILEVYDKNNHGEFIWKNSLILQSWYTSGKIQYQDLLGDGRAFILASLKTGGTGVGITILVIVGWNEDKFRVVAAEQISSYVSSSERVNFNANYKFHNAGSNKVSLVLNPHYEYAYYKFNKMGKPQKVNSINIVWNDELKWNKENFSFYKSELEESKVNRSKFFAQKYTAQTRLNVINQKLSNFDEDAWKSTEIVFIGERSIEK